VNSRMTIEQRMAIMTHASGLIISSLCRSLKQANRTFGLVSLIAGM
jgi:hypothetical protein